MAVFHSAYTAQQIENEIQNGVPYIRSTDNHWMRWDMTTGQFEDTGIIAQGQVANLIGTTNPTTSTVGVLTQIYMNTSNGTSWVCTAVTVGTPNTYTWVKVSLGASDIAGKENTSNKVSSWQASPDNTHYPSELLVKGHLDDINNLLDEIGLYRDADGYLCERED